MSEEKQQLLLIRGAIYGLPDTDRQGIDIAAAKLREIIALHNDHGTMAMALVVAEIASED